MQFIHTDDAPKAIGPYSQAVKVGNQVFTCGILGMTAEGTLVDSGVQNQVDQALVNLGTILEAAGAKVHHVVKVTLYVTNLDQFTMINERYQNFFGSHCPARSTVEVAALPKGASLELDAVAFIEA